MAPGPMKTATTTINPGYVLEKDHRYTSVRVPLPFSFPGLPTP